MPQVVSSRVELMLWKEKVIVFSDYDEDDKEVVTWYNLTTQEIKRLQIPVQYKIVKCVHQPLPTASSVGKDEDEDSSTEMTLSLLQQHDVQHQENLQVQEDNEQGEDEDEDDDNSSTDSAFLMPDA